MAGGLFDTGDTPTGSAPQTLADVLGQQAQTQTNAIKDAFAQRRRRQISADAASGRLGSAVEDYPLTDLDTAEGNALSGVQTNLESALGQIPSEDWLNSQEFNRNLDLTKYIGSLMKPSTLEEVLGGLGTALNIGGSAAGIASVL